MQPIRWALFVPEHWWIWPASEKSGPIFIYVKVTYTSAVI